MPHKPLILVVGVCASGKTTLACGLRELGYNARSFAQEHSVSAKMWRRYQPDLVIMLQCDYATIKSRKRISWGLDRYQEQLRVLANAREHATLIVLTDNFTPSELINHVHEKLLAMG